MYAQDNNSLPVWIILSPAHHHISINSQPFLVGIVSTDYGCISTTDLGIDQELFKFRAIIGHQGPLAATDPDWKGSK